VISAHVTIEGDLFSELALQAILDGSPDYPGINSEAYQIPKGERLSNHVTGVMQYLRNRLSAHRAASRPSHDFTWTCLEQLQHTNAHPFRLHGGERAKTADGYIYTWAGQDEDAFFAIAQRDLNRHGDVWGLVTLGERVRLIRTNKSLTKQAYVEFSLHSMLDEKDYSAFMLFFLLAHRTRFNRPSPLEGWRAQAYAAGERALTQIKKSVEQAIERLGTGFLHAGNLELNQRLAKGELSVEAFHRQVIRIAYRLIFLFVTEDRNLLLHDRSTPEARDAYTRYYSTARLRQLAEEIPGTHHTDLWAGLQVVFNGLKRRDGHPEIALPPLNGEMWREDFIQDLKGAKIRNKDLLHAVRALLKWDTEDGKRQHRINWRSFYAEELGGIYEGLLEDRPSIHGSTFELNPGGRERHSTSAHYTPPELIEKVLAGTVDLAIQDRLKQHAKAEDQVRALLSLKILDPACGSGHFLVAAARRIAERIAILRTAMEDPPADAVRRAKREVIRNCVYGVDVNPMSVELCKVGLWLEAMEPGKPLGYLEHKIRTGDSIFGCTERQLWAGIPSAAYREKQGIDDRDAALAAEKRNANYGASLLAQKIDSTHNYTELRAIVQSQLERINDLPEDTTDDIDYKDAIYRQLTKNTMESRDGEAWLKAGDSLPQEYYQLKAAMNLWCAAWTQVREPGSRPNDWILTEDLEHVLQDASEVTATVEEASRNLVARGSAIPLGRRVDPFHWDLEFPQVLANGGFDCVLGNPPYMGGSKVGRNIGEHLLAFFQFVAPGYDNRGDFAAQFFLKGAQVMSQSGYMGMVTTKTFNDGETRENGPVRLTSAGLRIHFAWPNAPWPGKAGVHYTICGFTRQPGPYFLSGHVVETITPSLTTADAPDPQPLAENEGLAGEGHKPSGEFFVVPKAKALQWIAQDPKNKKVLFPFFTGSDFTSNLDPPDDRWCIFMGRMEEAEARTFAEPFEWLEKHMKPFRQRHKRDRVRDRWWQFEEVRGYYLNWVKVGTPILVRPKVSETHYWYRVPGDSVVNDKGDVACQRHESDRAVLSSLTMNCWVQRYTTRMKSDVSYNIGRCHDTFPRPPPSAELASAARDWEVAFDRALKQLSLPPTKFFNYLNSPDAAAALAEYRASVEGVERAIFEAYGWSDLKPRFEFYKDEFNRTRWGLAVELRAEILKRLLALNLAIHERQPAARRLESFAHA
jgi:hypothetical protein